MQKQKVNEILKQYIGDSGLKQNAVAKKADISYYKFNSMLNGRRTIYADELLQICSALNVSADIFRKGA